MKAVAVIHHEEGKLEVINAIMDSELSRDDLLRIIIRQGEAMQRMQEDYNALLEMHYMLERQNKRLRREKFEYMEEQLPRRSFLLLKSK